LGHLAGGVEAHVERANGVGVLPGLGDAHRTAGLVGGGGGVGAGRAEAEALHAVGAEQGVGVAADDHVDAVELRREGLVGGVAEVGHQHDLVHAAGAQGVDGGLRGGGFVEEAGAGVGREAKRVLSLTVRPTTPTCWPLRSMMV
jgi:hypothetical protein